MVSSRESDSQGNFAQALRAENPYVAHVRYDKARSSVGGGQFQGVWLSEPVPGCFGSTKILSLAREGCRSPSLASALEWNRSTASAQRLRYDRTSPDRKKTRTTTKGRGPNTGA